VSKCNYLYLQLYTPKLPFDIKRLILQMISHSNINRWAAVSAVLCAGRVYRIWARSVNKYGKYEYKDSYAVK